MPKEYTDQRDAMMSEGMDKKKAQKIAAINYFKKHGVAVVKAEKMDDHMMKKGMSKKRG